MSRGNPVIKKTIAPTTRQVENQSIEQQISDIEAQLRPFKRMEIPDADNGERVLGASNIVIPNA